MRSCSRVGACECVAAALSGTERGHITPCRASRPCRDRLLELVSGGILPCRRTTTTATNTYRRLLHPSNPASSLHPPPPPPLPQNHHQVSTASFYLPLVFCHSHLSPFLYSSSFALPAASARAWLRILPLLRHSAFRDSHFFGIVPCLTPLQAPLLAA